MTTREHLTKMHRDAIDHHRFLAENEKDREAHHTALAKAHEEMGQPEIAKIHQKCAKSCQNAAEEHTACISRHEEMCKSIGVSDLSKANQIVPDHVRGIATSFPGIVAVPRTGQREISKAEQNVPIEFADLVKISDD